MSASSDRTRSRTATADSGHRPVMVLNRRGWRMPGATTGPLRAPLYPVSFPGCWAAPPRACGRGPDDMISAPSLSRKVDSATGDVTGSRQLSLEAAPGGADGGRRPRPAEAHHNSSSEGIWPSLAQRLRAWLGCPDPSAWQRMVSQTLQSWGCMPGLSAPWTRPACPRHCVSRHAGNPIKLVSAMDRHHVPDQTCSWNMGMLRTRKPGRDQFF